MFANLFNRLFGRVNAELSACETEGAQLTRSLAELRLKLVAARDRVDFASRQLDETFGALDSVDERPLSELDSQFTLAPAPETVAAVNGAKRRARKSKS